MGERGMLAGLVDLERCVGEQGNSGLMFDELASGNVSAEGPERKVEGAVTCTH